MCDPGSAAVVLTAASTLMQANAQYQQGKFAKGVSRYNARVAENTAERVRAKGTEEENIQRRRTAELVSKQRAQLGAANVDIDFGSAAQLQEDAITLGEADAMRIRTNTDDQATALQTQADLTKQQGDYAYDAGQNAAVGTLLGGGGSILGSGVADKWFTPDSVGVGTFSRVPNERGFVGGF